MGTSSASSVAAARTKANQPKRLGSETPRIFTPPLRALTRETTRGFECIEFAEEVLDIQLWPWQKWLLIHALELLEDGTFRFRYIVLLVARQNGKSTLMTVLSLWRMYVDGAPLIIGTAQNLDVAEEQWQTAVDIAESIPELAAEIAESGGVVKVNGKKTLKLVSGERYKVQAASRRGGRGLSGDLVLLDELREHQAWDAWAAVTKTTIAKAYAQIWAASNAGDASSIVLRFLRKLAHLALGDPDGINESGITETGITEAEALTDDDDDDDGNQPFVDDEDSLGIFEWSAPPGCAINDRGGWAQANPSLGYSIREKELASAARTDPEWVFRTECMCQWSEGTLEGPFPPGVWEKPAEHDVDGVLVLDEHGGCLDNLSKRRKKSSIGVGLDTSWDRSMTYIAMAGWRKDGLIHVELMAQRAGTDWAIPWVAERKKRLNVRATSFQANGAPVSSLFTEATAADISFKPWAGADLGRGTGDFYDKVRFRGIRHLVQPALDIAAATAVTKPAGDSWYWDRKNSPTDIAPLIAATAAVWALLGDEEETESAYADSTYDLMVM